MILCSFVEFFNFPDPTEVRKSFLCHNYLIFKQLLFNYTILNFHPFKFLNERSSHGNLEFPRQKLYLPFFLRLVKIHCQWNISLIAFYHLDKILSEFVIEHRCGYAYRKSLYKRFGDIAKQHDVLYLESVRDDLLLVPLFLFHEILLPDFPLYENSTVKVEVFHEIFMVLSK